MASVIADMGFKLQPVLYELACVTVELNWNMELELNSAPSSKQTPGTAGKCWDQVLYYTGYSCRFFMLSEELTH